MWQRTGDNNYNNNVKTIGVVICPIILIWLMGDKWKWLDINKSVSSQLLRVYSEFRLLEICLLILVGLKSVDFHDELIKELFQADLLMFGMLIVLGLMSR